MQFGTSRIGNAFHLPAKLHQTFLNLSTTVQQFIGELVLTVEGMPSRENRAENAKLEQAARARRANELINEKLKDFLGCHQLPAEDSAIAMAAANGRSTGEIAKFIGLEQRYVMRRLCHVRKQVSRWSPLNPEQEHCDGAEVLHIFAEAQRGRG